MFDYNFSIVHVFVGVFFNVCSPNLVALVLGFFDATSRHHVPKYYCGYIYIYIICVFIWCGVIIWFGVTALQTKTIA